jgi:calcium permeable stress-gated cation channel
LPSGWFNWIKPFYNIPDTFVLNHCSVDGFFFLRYIKVLCIICFAGCLFAWPVLLPLHGTGGRGLTELDLLTIGNVVISSKFYGHVFVAWGFFSKMTYPRLAT